MADTTQHPPAAGQRPQPAGRPAPTRGTAYEGVRAYLLVVRMWMRSTMAYRTSFALTTVGNLAVTALDFLTIVLMFSHIDALGGFTLPEVALLYGTTSVSFGLSDLLAGNAGSLGDRVRDGTFDTLLLRPAPLIAQVAADRFALRRLGRVTQGAAVLGWAVLRVDVHWTAGAAALLAVTLLAGTAIFCAVFVAGAAFQFWAGDASEIQNSVTYGGNTLLQYPPGLFGRELLRGVTFVVPLAFVNWMPVLHILGRPDPLGLPGWADYLGAPVAVLCCALAGLAWRAGVRSYRSTGS